MAVTEILLLVIIFIGIALSAYLITLINKLNGVLDSVFVSLKKFDKKSEPLLGQIHYLTIKVIRIGNKIEEKVYQIGYGITTIKNLVDSLISISGTKKSRESVSNLLVNAVAVSKNVSIFWKMLKVDDNK